MTGATDLPSTLSALPRLLLRPLRSPLSLPKTLPNFLLPSFIADPSYLSKEKVSSTAWLDGMRGIAAFLVYIRHFGAIHHPNIQVGYGGNEANRYIIQLPFIRLLIAGPAMVSMFFIISGYALSWAPLRALHIDPPAGSKGSRRENSMRRVASGSFRRAFRLFAPGVISTFFIMIFISLGFYDRGQRAWASTEGDIPGFHEPQPPMFRRDPFSVQFWDWVRCTWDWSNIFGMIGMNAYNAHLWTLNTEWKCSIALYVTLLALSGTRKYMRLVGLACMVIYCYYVNSWDKWLFFAGATIAQLRLLQEDNIRRNAGARSEEAGALLGSNAEKDVEGAKTEDGSGRWRYDLAPGDHGRIALFVIGLYLLSSPDYGFADWAPGYKTIATFNPLGWNENWRFPHCIGGAMTVYAVSSTRTRILRCAFDNKYARYLGKISYALYLVHGPIVHMLGFWLVPWFWKFTGKENMWGKELGWGLVFMIQTPLIIWAADLFWRGVDAKCVSGAKWFEDLVRDKEL